MLSIYERTWKNIVTHCKEQQPHEACGFLFGYADRTSGALRIERFIPVMNRSSQPKHHFDMEPAEFVRWLYEMRAGGQELVGILHSHPHSPPVPSEEDLKTPWYLVPSHWIVSLMSAEGPNARAYAYSAQANGKTDWSSLPIAILKSDA